MDQYVDNDARGHWNTYSTVASLGEVQPDDEGLGNTPDDEDDVGLPTNVLKRNRPSKLVKQTTSIDCQTRECHTLGTHLERQNLHGVQSLKRSNAEREDSAEHENHGDGSLGSA